MYAPRNSQDDHLEKVVLCIYRERKEGSERQTKATLCFAIIPYLNLCVGQR